MFLKFNRGQANIPIVIIISGIALILYLIATNVFYFNDRLFGVIYYKTPSKAFEGITPDSQNIQKIQTTTWEEKWDVRDYLQNWNKLSFDCSSITKNDTINFNCQDMYITSLVKWNKDFSIIITGSFTAKGTVGIGLSNLNSKSPYFQITTPSSDSLDNSYLTLENYQEGKNQEFKLVYTKINDNQFVYYYMNNEPDPIKKNQISMDQNPSVFLTCKGTCSISNLVIAGVRTD